METREFAPKEPQSVGEATRRFIEDEDIEAAIAFLRANREEVAEFCLQVRDRYAESDRTTPFVELTRLIQTLL
jgi:hypothetical protein